MIILYSIFFLCIGTYVGKFIALTASYLPEILMEGGDKGREPRDLAKWFFGKSRCPNCKHALNATESLPIFSFFKTRGKCPYCQHSHGLKFIILEVGIGLLFGLTVLLFGVTLPVILVLMASCLLICCFITDFEHGILPDHFTYPLIWIGLVASLNPLFLSPKEAIISAIAGYGVFWVINEIYRYFRDMDGMFPGDFKLNAGIGAFLGLKLLFQVIVLSFVLLIIFSLIRLIFFKKESGVSFLHQEVAYGCYASAITIFVLYFKLGIFG